jgi:sensor histidine kinase regulating citrate/malate metabolism
MLNAFDAIGDDGQVTITITHDDQAHAVITVADSGAGYREGPCTTGFSTRSSARRNRGPAWD